MVDPVVEEMIVKDEKISKAGTLKELGYLHIEQIDFLQKIQEFKISHQMNNPAASYGVSH